MVVFKHDTHQYFYEDEEYKSVSSIISSLKKPFDKQYWLEKKAKDRGITPEELEQEWNEINRIAIEKGKKYHDEQERILLSSGKNVIKSIHNHDGFKVAFDLSELKPATYPELLLYLPSHKIAGQSDTVIIHEDKTFTIRDFKTNKKLDFQGFKYFDPVKREKVTQKMLHPVNHLDDCNGMHYTVQLSLYAYMLEQYGFKCKDLYIDHVIFDDTDATQVVTYPVNYLKKECISILKCLKK